MLSSLRSFIQNQMIFHYLHNISVLVHTHRMCGSWHKSNMCLSLWLVLQLELAVLFADSGTRNQEPNPTRNHLGTVFCAVKLASVLSEAVLLHPSPAVFTKSSQSTDSVVDREHQWRRGGA